MPKIIGGSLEEHRRQTREKIFAAVGELMDEQSFEHISFAEIAARADVGRTALYNHFADKEDLVLAYTMDETTKYVDALRAGLEGATDPTDAIRLYIRRHLELRQTFHVTAGPELRSLLSPAALGQLKDHVMMVTGVLREILETGVSSGDFEPALDIDATIPLVNACLVGRHIPDVPGAAHERAATSITRFVMRGIGTRSVPDGPLHDGPGPTAPQSAAPAG